MKLSANGNSAKVIVLGVSVVMAISVHLAIVAFYYGRVVEKVETNNESIERVDKDLSGRIERMEDRLVDRLRAIEENMSKTVKNVR